MSDAIEFTIPGPPPQKNARHKLIRTASGHASRRNSDRFLSLIDAFAIEWRRRRDIEITDGVWHCEVRAYWGRKSKRAGCEGVGVGDVDAPLSSILDAIQRAGILDDDVRFVSLTATKHYDKDNPRTEIKLERIA